MLRDRHGYSRTKSIFHTWHVINALCIHADQFNSNSVIGTELEFKDFEQEELELNKFKRKELEWKRIEQLILL